MGTKIEINDTLVITTEQGFPSQILDLSRHAVSAIELEQVQGRIFQFSKDEARIFHLDPVRIFLVQSIDGKWLHWGQAVIQSQMISKALSANGEWIDGEWVTSGSFKIIKLHDPEYQKLVTMNESPKGRSYF